MTASAIFCLHSCEYRHNGDWVRFWAAVRKQAFRLLGHLAVPGVDYAMTEVVHCKSAGERGVADALCTLPTATLTASSRYRGQR